MHLNRWYAAAFSSLITLQLGCTITHTSQAPVEISGNQSTDKKVEMAQLVARRVLESGLQDRLLARFPELDRDRLAGLEVRAATIVDTASADMRSEPIVRVVCSLRYEGKLNVAPQVVNFCASEVRAALRSQYPQ